PGEATEDALGHEEDRGEENEERHHSREDGLPGAREQNAARQTAEQAHEQKSFQPRFHGGDLPAETIDTPDRAKDQRERAGGVGGRGRRSEKQQGRESDERSTARYGVDHPRRSRSRSQSDDFRSRHAGRESVGSDVQLKPTGEAPKISSRFGWIVLGSHLSFWAAAERNTIPKN